jgi:hypothetical protein
VAPKARSLRLPFDGMRPLRRKGKGGFTVRFLRLSKRRGHPKVKWLKQVLRKLSVGRVARTQMRPTDQAHRRGKLSKASILIRPRRGRLDAVAINCIALNEPMNS